MDSRLYKGGFSVGNATAALNVPFAILIPPVAGAVPVVNKIQVNCGSTAHTISFLHGQGQTTTSAAAAAGDSTLTLTSTSALNDQAAGAATETLASGDWLVVQHANGSWGHYLVSSVSGSVVTLNTSAPGSTVRLAVNSGATVWALYEPSRPKTAKGYPSVDFLFKASTISAFGGENPDGALVRGEQLGAPMLVYNANATAASFIDYIVGFYSRV